MKEDFAIDAFATERIKVTTDGLIADREDVRGLGLVEFVAASRGVIVSRNAGVVRGPGPPMCSATRSAQSPVATAYPTSYVDGMVPINLGTVNALPRVGLKSFTMRTRLTLRFEFGSA